MQASVLLVEDNDDDATLISRVLSKSVRVIFDVARVGTLADAEQQIAKRRYDAIVVDLGLPDSDGLATFVTLYAKAKSTAVVVLTGNDREDLGLKAVELGAQEYIVKSERAWPTLPMAIAYAVGRARRQQEAEELTTALANAVDAIATLDGRGAFASVNGAFQALLGYESQIIVGTPLLDLVHEADRPFVSDILSAGKSAGKPPKEVEVRAIRKDGRIIPIQLSFVNRSGGRGHFCFVRDLSRQKEVEGKIAGAAAVTAVTYLATGLAHEINNPLAVVLANVEEAGRIVAELAQPDTEGRRQQLEDLQSMLEEALSAAQRVQLIVRDLRSFASADDRRSRVDVNAVIEAACNIAFAEIRHRARLVKELGAQVPVLANEAKLAQVFLNLLVNAAHAMPEGEVERNEIRVTSRQQERSAVVVEIADTGSGIPPAELGRVFEPFFTTKPRRPGMGLAICRATIASHGGEITIGPREGGGTIVRIVLPTLEAESSKAQVEPLAQPRRVLVVDDDPLVLRSLTRVLARDFAVAAARNGREALDLVRAGATFDAMLCDLMMPEMSGIELHAVLERDDPELAKRIIFLTGGTFSGRARTFLETIGQPHLDKPVDLKTVRELLFDLSRNSPESTRGKWLRCD
jgi:PAS domain S-box-containing protein